MSTISQIQSQPHFSAWTGVWRFVLGVVLSALRGGMLLLSFPPYGIWPLAWVALIPAVFAQYRLFPQRLSSLAGSLLILFWLGPYMGSAFGPRMAYLGVPIAFAVLFIYIERKYHELTGFRWFVLYGTFLWVGQEMIRALFVPGFGTAAFIGYTQATQAWMLQPVAIGETDVTAAVLVSPLTIREVVQFGERLRSKKLWAHEFLEPEEDYFLQEEFNVPQTLSLIERVKKLDERYRQVQKNLDKGKISESNLIRVNRQLRGYKRKIASLLEDLNAQTGYVDKITQKLKGFAEEVQKVENELQEIQDRGNIPLGQFQDYRRLMKEPQGFRTWMRKSRLSKEKQEQYRRVIKNAKHKIRRVEEESNLSVEELKQTLRVVESGETKAGIAKKALIEANLRLVVCSSR